MINRAIIFILAGNYKEYCYFIKINNLNKRTYIYLDSPDRIRGCNYFDVIRIGTYSFNNQKENLIKIYKRGPINSDIPLSFIKRIKFIVKGYI